MQLKKILFNKVLLYVGSRYIVYGLQFISLMVVASKLGSYNYGIWGFILMILSYMNIINLGIPNSINVLIVQYKKSINLIKDYISSAFMGIGILIGILGLLAGGLYIIGPAHVFIKFPIGQQIYLILLIGALQYLNVLMVNIFRANNKLFEIAVYQSTIPIGIFIVALAIPSAKLINWLIGVYLVMNIFSLSFFIIRGKELWGGSPSRINIQTVIGKGIYLFIYNACFYLIVTTTSTLVSRYYPVAQYGDYSFSYTLGHSILLLMEAFMYVMFPKVIDKFYNGSDEEVDNTIKAIRVNYISLAHFLIYIAFAIFPLIIDLIPGFKSTLITLNFMMLAIVLSTNAFGYNTLLIARNKEKLSSIISIVTLIFSISIGWLLAAVVKIPYFLMPLTIMGSYFIFAILCSYAAHDTLRRKISIWRVILTVMPTRIAIPYACALLIAYINNPLLSLIPLIIFCVTNTTTLKDILKTIRTIINRPHIVDIHN